MKCAQCNFENPDGFAFCGKCGAPLTASCPQCGFNNPPKFAFCGKCGAALGKQAMQLTKADLNHLRAYLPSSLIEALQLELLSPSPALLKQCTNHLIELLKTLSAHLPAYLVEEVLQNPAPGQTGGRFVDGALLFADISGFTAMSERLSRIGREGAEEITLIVNRYFGAMLNILREHQGQLIKFGGDALLGMFTNSDSAVQAVQAAMKMQAAMNKFTKTRTSQGVFSLQMKIGLRWGRFFAAQLGSTQTMEYALFGSDVNAAAATESAAMAGQVLLNREMAGAIDVPFKATPLKDNAQYLIVEEVSPAPLLPRPPASSRFSSDSSLENLLHAVEILDALAPYLPAGLLSRAAADPHAASLEGEHRLVSVLFANVRGLDDIVDRLGPGQEDRIVATLNRYFSAMADAIHRFGGVVNKIDLYDHGNKLLAFFGAPLAHEDDAERAVRAALAMQEAFDQLSQSLPAEAGFPDLKLSQRIGITYGYVFAGYVGTSWRREYTVMGDEVNLSARLMSVAQPGSIIVSSNVRRKIEALFDFGDQGEVRLKGKSDPVPIFSIIGPRAAPEAVRGIKGMRSPLVGREKEWRQLTTALDELLLGRGQIVSIIGEAGLGKSRLLDEISERLTAGDIPPLRWLAGHCLSYTESVSYWPFQDLIRQLAGLKQEEGPWESWNKLRHTLEKKFSLEEVPEILPYLANFLGLPIESSLQKKVRYLDAEAMQQRTFVAISALLKREASAPALGELRPLVLTIDDLHWLDQASQELLEYLMPLVNRIPLMLLLLYRPEREKACWHIREKAGREFPHCVTEITLSPLTADDSQALLSNLVSLENGNGRIQNLILSQSEGNPLYLEEVIRSLIDAQMLAKNESGHWQITGQPENIRVPDTLQGVIMTRLDRLEEPCRWTVQCASVIGRNFPFNILNYILQPDNDGQLNYCMIQLQQHEITHETRRVPELVYSFTHTMTQEVSYHSLLARRRRLYHQKVARYLEKSPSGSLSEVESNYHLIAHHAFMGGDWSRALRYQMIVGQQAQKLFANHDAIDHFQKALRSADHLPPEDTLEQRQIIHAALGESFTSTGQYNEALPHLSAAYALAIERQDACAQAHVCRWLTRLHELRGEYSPAFKWIERGLKALGDRKTTETAELSLIAGLIYTRQGDYESAIAQCQHSLLIAQQLDEITVLARAYILQGHIARLLGRNAEAIEHFQQALKLYRQAGDLNGQATSNNQIGNAYFNLGNWQEADRSYRWARKIFEQIGDVYHRIGVDNNLGGIALNQGRLDEALNFYRDALQSLEKIGGSLWILGALHTNLGHTFIRLGDVETARQHLRSSQDYFEQAQSRDWLPEVYRHCAEVELLADNLAEAETQGRKALDLARELSMKAEEGCSLRVLGEIAIARKQFKRAEEKLKRSIALLDKAGDEYELARSQLSIAKLYITQKKQKDGHTALKRCLTVFEGLNAALDLKAARALQQKMKE